MRKKAVWHAPDGDHPIVIIDFLGEGPDGRDYVRVEDSDTGIPLDQCEMEVQNKIEEFQKSRRPGRKRIF